MISGIMNGSFGEKVEADVFLLIRLLSSRCSILDGDSGNFVAGLQFHDTTTLKGSFRVNF